MKEVPEKECFYTQEKTGIPNQVCYGLHTTSQKRTLILHIFTRIISTIRSHKISTFKVFINVSFCVKSYLKKILN